MSGSGGAGGQGHSAQSAQTLSKAVLSLPKFTFGEKVELSAVLSRMGMPLALQGLSAEFSGTDGERDLYLYQVESQARIKLDEPGTVAVAATAAVNNCVALTPMRGRTLTSTAPSCSCS